MAARMLADELAAAMRNHHLGRHRLGEICGISHTLIAQYRAGATLPRLEMAGRLAEALDCPVLLTITSKAREGRCAVTTCERPFVNDACGVKRYCSADCRRIAAKLRAPSATASERTRRRAERLAQTPATRQQRHADVAEGMAREAILTEQLEAWLDARERAVEQLSDETRGEGLR